MKTNQSSQCANVSLILVLTLTACSLPISSNPTLLSNPPATGTLLPLNTPTMSAIEPTNTLAASVTPTNTPTPTSSTAMVTPLDKDANCRYGPGTAYLAVGGLKVGVSVPILATISGQTWWQIQNPLDLPGRFCWVSASVTSTSGDLSAVPVIPIPTGIVTDLVVSVNPGSTVHGFCGGPNAVNFQIVVTTNGPATVTYHLEFYNSNNTLRNSPGDSTIVFNNASSQTISTDAYKTDCGSYYIKVIVTSPNSKTAQANWSVVNP